MGELLRSGRWRTGALGMVFGVMAIAMGATPSLAATSPFQGTFNETTTFRACPPGIPAGAFCFSGHGTAISPVMPPGDPNATEDYVGFVDVHTFVGPCPLDRNAVRITTSAGTLFLTTKGAACPGVDNATWQAAGGTGIFEGATGAGTVQTLTIGQNPDGTVSSKSTYTGTLTLQNSD